MPSALDTLTEKEKDTLRLIVRGHDAKSAACELGLSVHTINERLRAARAKLETTSSREAARMLFEAEEATPENLGDKGFGDDDRTNPSDPPVIEQPARKRAFLIGGIVMMFALVTAGALVLSNGAVLDRKPGDPATPIENVQLSAFEATARDWLALVDAGDWDRSFAEAGRAFRDPNTATTWREASEQARMPLGAMIERKTMTIEFIGSERTDAKAEPSAVVVFETRFENRSKAIERVSLEMEHGEWRVVGYLID